MAIVDIADLPLPVNDDLGRHASQFEQVDFLAVKLQHARLRVGQAGERQIVLIPIGLKRPAAFSGPTTTTCVWRFSNFAKSWRNCAMCRWQNGQVNRG